MYYDRGAVHVQCGSNAFNCTYNSAELKIAIQPRISRQLNVVQLLKFTEKIPSYRIDIWFSKVNVQKLPPTVVKRILNLLIILDFS